jgi:arylsulfatase
MLISEPRLALAGLRRGVVKLMKTYVQYPPRKLQSATYTGPLTITDYQRFQQIRDQLKAQGVTVGIGGGQ